jgi:hypothetical protein
VGVDQVIDGNEVEAGCEFLPEGGLGEGAEEQEGGRGEKGEETTVTPPLGQDIPRPAEGFQQQ